MRSTILKSIILAIVMMAFVSCTQENVPNQSSDDSKVSVTDTGLPTAPNEEVGMGQVPGSENDTTDTTSVDETLVEAPIQEVVSYKDLGVNEMGKILVVMYHGIKDKPPYHRTKEDFIKDLTYFYEHDYYLISISEYVSQRINVPTGKTPIVLTFDDGLASTFSLQEVNGELEVAPDTAVGIIEGFVENHEGFGHTATLFIHDTNQNFRGDGSQEERLNWLVNHGYELGNHSATHEDLSGLTETQLIKEIGQVDLRISTILPNYKMISMTYPFGKRPKEELRDSFADHDYENIHYAYKVAFREGPSSSMVTPLHVNYEPYNAPRVRGSEGEVQDLWWFLDYFNNHPEDRFISDGDPATIVIPMSQLEFVNSSKLEGLTLITYE